MADRLAEPVDIRSASAGVALVTLNLPQLRNAMTTELTAAWTTAMDQIAADRSLRAVVVTGAGSSFCSGADLSWLDQGSLSDNTPDRLRDTMLPFYRAWLAPRQVPVPVVAAVNGPAVGIGLSLALACDLILAAESAFFGLAFVNIGLMPDGGSTLFVPATVGKARAYQMAMLGERIEAPRALDWGLINAVHPDDRLMDEANTLVAQLAGGPTRSYASTKKALNKMLYPDMSGQLDLEAELQHALARSKDFMEGVGAFIEKREAQFTGT